MLREQLEKLLPLGQSIGLIIIVACMALWQFERLELLNTAMLFLIPIVFAGVRYGKLFTFGVSIIAVLVLNVLFIPDRFSIAITNIHYLISFVMMIALGQLIVSLAQKAALIERFETSKKVQEALLGLLSHELRTPLTAIKGSSSALLDVTIPLEESERRYLLESIDESADDMEKLIDNLLDSARLQGGHFSLKTQSYGTEDIVRAIMQKSEAYKVIPIRVDSALTATMQGDMTLIEVAIGNLLDNALKYGSEPKLSVEAFANNRICFRVCNKGRLPSNEELMDAKKPFVRLSNAKGKRGAGLGLYVVDLIAKLHGGELGLKRSDDELCVSLIIPQRVA